MKNYYGYIQKFSSSSEKFKQFQSRNSYVDLSAVFGLFLISLITQVDIK